jgi:hypothetical protein
MRRTRIVWVVAAAPHLVDDLWPASPELALVDLDLAAKLRADIRTGVEFRPRLVTRPEFRLLLPDPVPVDVLPDTVPVEEVTEPRDDVLIDAEIVVDALFVSVAPEPPATDDVSELPDYIVRPDDCAVEDRIRVEDDSVDQAPAMELTDDIVSHEESVVGSVFVDVALEPAVIDSVSDLPGYIVHPDDDSVDEELTISDYPLLPDLGEANDALEKTDAALRKIREQLSGETSSHERRRLRRGFTVASGLGSVAALAVFAVDVQQGVATLPGWLGF